MSDSLIGSTKFLEGIPATLRQPLLDAYNQIVRNYRERRWEPSELNGGKLCEICYCILKGHVSGVFPSRPSKPSNMVDACNSLAQAGNFSRSVKIQIPRMLISLYEIRNNRNVGHVGADVDPNHMDATVVLSMSKWVMSELVRIFHNTTTDDATVIVDAISDRTLPLLWKVGDRTRVLGTHLGAKDKMLALLFGSPCAMSVHDIAESIEYKNLTQFRDKILKPAHKADLIHFDVKKDTVELSPIGVRHVETDISMFV
jgi:hypothetical protein